MKLLVSLPSNILYPKSYCDLIKIKKKDVTRVDEIPFLPINFFRTHNLNSSKKQPDIKFVSSRTTSQNGSTHLINDIDIYIKKVFKIICIVFEGIL